MKQLHTGQYLWPTYYKAAPLQCLPLPDKLNSKVVIVGGGISGLLTAYQLWKQHIPFILVEAYKIGFGSTLASTGLIQCASDINLPNLRSLIGREQADCFYKASALAINELEEITGILKQTVGDPHFYRRDSIQYAVSPADVEGLYGHYSALQSIDIPCELIGEQQLQEQFSLRQTIAVNTKDDAELNPHLFVLYLAQFLVQQGALLYEHAYFSKTEHANGTAYTVNNTIPVQAEHIIYTVGYAAEQLHESYIRPILNRSYVIATYPLDSLPLNYNKQLIWETATPYFYVRSTVDNRLIIGGLDEKQATPNEDSTQVNDRNRQLLDQLSKLFHKQSFSIAYSWNGTFAESRDKLPFIGASPNDASISYLCGFGGNGIVYSQFGAKLLADYIHDRKKYETDPLSRIVSLTRHR